MAAGAGKVALATGTTTLNCNTAATCTAAGTLGRIVDLVGYGNATFFEGAAAAPTLNATSSAVRAGSGCTETDDNAADFAALSPPAPRNSATTAFACGGAVDQPVVATCGGPLTVVQGVGGSRAVSATDPDDTVVSLALASVSPAPAAGTIALTDVTAATADGGTATGTLGVSATGSGRARTRSSSRPRTTTIRHGRGRAPSR